jgi:hypothetical protein
MNRGILKKLFPLPIAGNYSFGLEIITVSCIYKGLDLTDDKLVKVNISHFRQSGPEIFTNLIRTPQSLRHAGFRHPPE